MKSSEATGKEDEVDEDREKPPTKDVSGSHFVQGPSTNQDNHLNNYKLFPLPSPPLIVSRPGCVVVEMVIDETRMVIGKFLCGYKEPAPMTDAERRAISSRPGANKTLFLKIACKQCGSKVDFYEQLYPKDTPPSKAKDAIWIGEAPDHWKCKCENNFFDLSYIKAGIHDVFRWSPAAADTDARMSFIPLYEAGRINKVIGNYENLIEHTKNEEEVQKFLEKHPLFWSFISPVKILHKPPVLTKKKADFGVLSAQNVFYLVEIEKPSTRLINGDGSISADIQKGAEQIRDWDLVVSDHKLALLSELELKPEEVQEIRYILVGGLARKADPAGLTKLRRTQLAPKTDFYCFDELGSFLHVLSGGLKDL